MKSLFKNLLYLGLTLSLISCLPEKSSNSNSSDSGDDTTTTGSTGGSGGGSGSGGSSGGGNSCSGSTSDGQGSGYPIHHFDMLVAGHQSWVPGDYADPLAQQTMPTLQEASLLFNSDAKLRVRVKIKSQPYPTTGEEYCYGRETGRAADQFVYSKLRFRLHLRDILCDTVDPNDSSSCQSGFYLGPRYQSRFIDPVEVSRCSGVIDLGHLRNQTQFGTTVEIEDVKADSTCQSNGTYCPAEKVVRTASCWNMTLQVVTDYTQDFK